MRFLRAMIVSLNLFALMVLFGYISNDSLEGEIKLNLAWALITGFGIEFLYPLVAKLFTKDRK